MWKWVKELHKNWVNVKWKVKVKQKKSEIIIRRKKKLMWMFAREIVSRDLPSYVVIRL